MYHRSLILARGDPGFFSFLGGIAKSALRIGGSAILGTLTGGPVAGIAAAVKSTISTTRNNIGSATLEAGDSSSALTPEIIARHRAAVARGSAGIGIMAPGGGAPMITPGGGGGRRQSARHLHALAMGLSRAKPRMQVTNTRALYRALRRAHGFARVAMKTIHLIHPKKKGRFGGFRKKRAR